MSYLGDFYGFKHLLPSNGSRWLLFGEFFGKIYSKSPLNVQNWTFFSKLYKLKQKISTFWRKIKKHFNSANTAYFMRLCAIITLFCDYFSWFPSPRKFMCKTSNDILIQIKDILFIQKNHSQQNKELISIEMYLHVKTCIYCYNLLCEVCRTHIWTYIYCIKQPWIMWSMALRLADKDIWTKKSTFGCSHLFVKTDRTQ